MHTHTRNIMKSGELAVVHGVPGGERRWMAVGAYEAEHMRHTHKHLQSTKSAGAFGREGGKPPFLRVFETLGLSLSLWGRRCL